MKDPLKDGKLIGTPEGMICPCGYYKQEQSNSKSKIIYNIKITYESGSSLGPYEISEDFISCDFSNLDIVQKNIQKIKEHHELYENINSYITKINKTNDEILLENCNKEWFNKKMKPWCKQNDNTLFIINEDNVEECKKKYGEDSVIYIPDQYSALHQIWLKNDNNIDFIQSAFWHGYFEKLISIECIINKSQSNLRIDYCF